MLKVAVIEDSPEDLELILNIFKGNKNFKVEYIARDIGQAELLFHKTPPDIILLDLILNDKDGIQLIPIMKKKWGKSTIIVVSKLEMVNKIVQARRAGAIGYLLKQDSVEENLSRIYLAMNGEPYLSPMVQEKLQHHAVYPEEGFKKAIQDDPRITKCEKKVLTLAYEGLTGAGISKKLKITSDTIKKHKQNSFRKLGVSSLKDAIYAVFYGNKK